MRIDAHQHFWDISRLTYPWMPSDPSPLRRNYLPSDLKPILETHRFEGSIVVQAHHSLDETRWLLELARDNEFIKGVVAWVDLTDPQVGKTLDELQRDPHFKGVRHLVHDESDPRWLLRADVLQGLAALEERGIPYDLLLRPVHLPLVPELAGKLPGLPMVIDHIAKPSIAMGIATGEFDRWARLMEAVFPIPNLCCKLSGMITEAAWHNWSPSDLRPYVAHVLQGFGPNRLMYGSDWPVCLLAGTYKEVFAACTQALGPLPMDEREQILGGTAMRFYRIAE
jgi:L-fuconolactonase